MGTRHVPQTKSTPAVPAPSPQRTSSHAAVKHSLVSTIHSTPAVRLGGDPLPNAARVPLETTFGADLSPVRVHSDGQSTDVVKRLDARAFAYGSHIFVDHPSRTADLPLMAHEVTHVLQQSSTPAVRLSSASYTTDAYEAEANAGAAAAARGEAFTVRQQTPTAHPQFDNGGGILGRIVNAILGAVRSIPGYMLISFIIGRDIVANRPVERNAVNLVGAIMGLVPGGNVLFENLQRSGALQRAFDWFSTEFTRLNITWDYIRGLFSRFTDSLGLSDVFNPSGVIARLRDVFGEPVRRLRDFAVNAVMKVLEFIFEGVMGAGGAQILAILRRARATFELIIRDPIRFVGNLVRAVVGGFNQFKNNILRHLQAGLIGWLTGALGGAGITLPPRFDARGILSLILQILGLTYRQLRVRLVRLIGEPRVRLLEGAFEFIRILVTQGLVAAWQKILEFAGNLADMVISGIRDFVVQTIVQQAVIRLISFFNPAGAIIQAILAIYNTVQWFIQRMQQIMQLVNAVVESISNIAAGSLGAAMNYVEQTMGRALPVIISFLAALLGLNRIADHIRRVIQRIQAVVNRALDRVFDFLAQRIRSFAGPGGDQDPNLRLERALNDAQPAVNRFAGRTVGVVVLRPILAAIRLRYRLTSLEAVPDGNNWAVEGAVNPRRRVPTRVLRAIDEGNTAAGTGPRPGSQQNPFLLTWPKPMSLNYPRIYLGGPVRTPRSQAIQRGLWSRNANDSTGNPVREYLPHSGGTLPDGETIGIAPNYRITHNKVIGPLSNSTTPGGGILNRVLRKYGYVPANEGTDADHVTEIQMGGRDELSNLWPLDASINRSAGSMLSRTRVGIPGTNNTISIAELKAAINSRGPFYFKIR